MNRSNIITTLRDFKTINKSKYGILSLGIFGSVARNQASDNSDVDIVVRTETPDMFNLVHMKDALEKELKTSVDIIRLRDHMNPFLKRRIETEALYV